MTKKAPRWTIAFLRALTRTGDVRAAAADAGIDYTTAYARRKAHAEFAGLWRGALAAHAQLVKRDEDEQVRALARGPSTMHSSVDGPPPPDKLREDLVGAGGQMKRAGHGRWSRAKETLFFEELAATANVRRAAKAAGVSPNAVFARRLKHPLFRAKWAAVVATAKSSIDLYLVEASNKTFDPDALDGGLDTGEVQPKVSVAEAIRIVQSHGSKAEREQQDYFAQQAAEMGGDDIEAVRKRLLKKFERLRKREMARALDEGWTLDESHDCIVPPGWIKGPDYQPKAPEEPGESGARDR
jgi:hypothetical protein